ncbi:MAG: hypothetical protein AAF653_21395, partial [Chloroflexota bacterium]
HYREHPNRYKLPETRAHVQSLDLPRETVILTLTPFYEDFLAYPNFLSWSGGERYGMELRGETYTDLLERERPTVIISESQHSELLGYMERHEFVPVMQGLFMHPELCAVGYCAG